MKFLKCKCILQNYSMLGLPPPLVTPRRESGAAQLESPGARRCIIILSIVLLSLAEMRTIIIIGVFSLMKHFNDLLGKLKLRCGNIPVAS